MLRGKERKNEQIGNAKQRQIKKTYILKINCKGKRTVGKANKGINVEKIIGLKIKIKKREKLHRTSKAQCKSREVCNNNKKCD